MFPHASNCPDGAGVANVRRDALQTRPDHRTRRNRNNFERATDVGRSRLPNLPVPYPSRGPRRQPAPRRPV